MPEQQSAETRPKPYSTHELLELLAMKASKRNDYLRSINQSLIVIGVIVVLNFLGGCITILDALLAYE